MYANRRTLVIPLSLLVGITLMTGCDVLKLNERSNQLERLQIVSQPNANQTSTTTMDLLFIYNEHARSSLPDDATAWFATRRQRITDLAADIDLLSLDVPPGHIVDEVKLPNRHRSAVDVVVYANYLSKKGQKRLSIAGVPKTQLTLKRDHIENSAVTD